MNKKRNEELMQEAENALKNDSVKIFENKTAEEKGIIKDSYNGQTAALGVTIAMSGLRPALAIYLKGTKECDKLQILNAIAVMLGIGLNQKDPGKELFKKVIDCDDNLLKEYKKDIIDCSIALKQVIRTYKLVK
jgi:hypothetical protein